MPLHPSHRQAGYSYLLHRRHESEVGGRTSAAGLLICGEHSGTHIDALCHQAEDMVMCGGVKVDSSVQTPKGFTRLGAETIPPMNSPGVLLDVASEKGVESLPPGYLVTADDLTRCVDSQGTPVETGAVVLVRTGNGRFWSDEERYLAGPGISAGASAWLAGHAPLAVGSDNVAWDLPERVDPEYGCALPGHLILLVRGGTYIMENLMLEGLAAAGCMTFRFVCAPLKLVGATGSPIRPLASSLPGSG